ncbi:tagaturonate reductase [Flagellimonas iocasae]|uniref:Tagaturonate reductase n=1 Tax=Flagellimonas iocasae TaxID=2055905 RepID=A0ABW4XU61_9FLAO
MRLDRNTISVGEKLPIKIVQFGEGNFLRAFVDYSFQRLNDETGFQAGIAIVQPIKEGLVHVLDQQDGLYTLFLNGIKDGKPVQEKHLISNIVKGVNPYADFSAYCDLAKVESLQYVISNTTEAGIAFDENDSFAMEPPNSFPAKLVRFLFERFQHFNGDFEKGLTIIPCELINYNADTLKEILVRYSVKWELGNEFTTWLKDANSFHNTLVDRIVPGYPKDDFQSYAEQLDYEDGLMVTAEHYFLWIIEGGAALKEKLPFANIDLDVKIIEDMQPYRTRKVRILNGAHTAMVPFSILFGNTTVRETIENTFTGTFIRKVVFEEIIPTLDMDKKELENFAYAVFDRFRNPYIQHQLSSIALNSISKFKVRVLPSLMGYIEKNDKLPKRLTFSLACLIRFYKGDYAGAKLPVNDGENVVKYFETAWNLPKLTDTVSKILENPDFWGRDLTKIPELTETVALVLQEIEVHGVEEGYRNYASKVMA